MWRSTLPVMLGLALGTGGAAYAQEPEPQEKLQQLERELSDVQAQIRSIEAQLDTDELGPLHEVKASARKDADRKDGDRKQDPRKRGDKRDDGKKDRAKKDDGKGGKSPQEDKRSKDDDRKGARPGERGSFGFGMGSGPRFSPEQMKQWRERFERMRASGQRPGFGPGRGPWAHYRGHGMAGSPDKKDSSGKKDSAAKKDDGRDGKKCEDCDHRDRRHSSRYGQRSGRDGGAAWHRDHGRGHHAFRGFGSHHRHPWAHHARHMSKDRMGKDDGGDKHHADRDRDRRGSSRFGDRRGSDGPVRHHAYRHHGLPRWHHAQSRDGDRRGYQARRDGDRRHEARRPAGPGRDSRDRDKADLERKVEQLSKEIESLKRALRRN